MKVSGSVEPMVEAIDVSGTLKWGQSPGDWHCHVHRLMAGPDGGVLVEMYSLMGEHYILRAVSAESGRHRWSLYLHTHERAEYALSKDGSVFVSRGRRKDATFDTLELYRLSGDDGSVLWNVSGWQYHHIHLHIPPPILGSNGEVYMSSMTDQDGGYCRLRAFDFDGNLLRTLPCHDYQHSTRQSEDGDEEDIFVAKNDFGPSADRQTTVEVYSGTTGLQLWSHAFATSQTTDLYVGPDAAVILVNSTTAIAVHNGEEAWREHVGSRNLLMAADGTTYNLYHDTVRPDASNPAILLALDTKGVQKWKYTAECNGLVQSSFV